MCNTYNQVFAFFLYKIIRIGRKTARKPTNCYPSALCRFQFGINPSGSVNLFVWQNSLIGLYPLRRKPVKMLNKR